MKLTFNQLMIMLAVRSGAASSSDIGAALNKSWGLKMAPSNIHVSTKKLVGTKDIKSAKAKKDDGRAVVMFSLTSQGQKRLDKIMTGFDGIRAAG